jgi:hypothetical protein
MIVGGNKIKSYLGKNIYSKKWDMEGLVVAVDIKPKPHLCIVKEFKSGLPLNYLKGTFDEFNNSGCCNIVSNLNLIDNNKLYAIEWVDIESSVILRKLYPNTKLFRSLYPEAKVVNNTLEVEC